MVCIGPFTLCPEKACVSSIFFFSLLRICSTSKEVPPLFSRFRISFTMLSAVSFASERIFAASSLARLRIFSLPFSIPFVDSLARAFKRSTSSLYCSISSLSLSARRLLSSKSAIKSSKCKSSSPIRPLASSMIFSLKPSFFAIAKALDFPGTPISRR